MGGRLDKGNDAYIARAKEVLLTHDLPSGAEAQSGIVRTSAANEERGAEKYSTQRRVGAVERRSHYGSD